MIDHVKLLIVFCNLLIGSGLAVYIYQAYRRFSCPPLKPLFFQIICFNLTILLLLATKYYDVNIQPEVPLIPLLLDNLWSISLLYFFLIGFSYSSLGIYLTFLDKKISKTQVRWLAGATILIIAFLFCGPFLGEDSLSMSLHYHFFENFGVVFVLLEVGLMIALPIKAGRLQDKPRTRAIRAFSILYIARIPTLALLILVPQPFRLMLGLLVLNLFPFIWYRIFMLPYLLRADEQPAVPMDLCDFAQHYKLSPRETEILELIMAGKSNRDMEEDLFISYHTVKNHVYNLYRKLGVKTRFELLHLVTSAGE